VPSLYNLINADRVETFLKDLETANGGAAFHDRDRLLNCIHMLIWLHSSRPGSTASAYATLGLMEALGLARWEYKSEPEAEVSTPMEAEPVQPGIEGIAGLFPNADAETAPAKSVLDPQVEFPADFLADLEARRNRANDVLHAVQSAVDSVFLMRFTDLVRNNRQPTVGGKPTSYSAWISAALAPTIARQLRCSGATEPTQEMVEAAAEGVMAEWKTMGAELGADNIPWPISPANYRLLRAGIRAALGRDAALRTIT